MRILGFLLVLVSANLLAEERWQKITPDDFRLDFEEQTFQGEGFVLPQTMKQPDLDYLDQVPYFLAQVEWRGVEAPLQKKLQQAVTTLYLNRDISVGDLYRLANDATYFLMQQGYVLGRVFLPAQTLRQQTVKFVVVLGKIDRIWVNEKDYTELASEKIRRRLNKVQAQSVTTSDVLTREVLLINDYPGYRFNGEFKASPSQTGAADLLAKLDHQPYELLVKVNNFGDDYTGKYRTSVLAASNDFLGWQEKFSLGISFSNQVEQLYSATLGMHLPLGMSDWTLESTLSYSQTQPKGELETLGIHGQNYGFDIKFSYPLVRKLSANLNASVGMANYAFDYYFDSPLLAVGRYADAKVWRFDADLTGNWSNEWLHSGFYLRLKQGVDALYTGTQTQTMPEQARLDFTTVNVGGQYLQRLYFPHLSAIIKLDYQYGKALTLTTERVSYGAEHFARGLTYGAISGDKGQAASFELKYDWFLQGWLKRVSPYGFYDSAQVERVESGTSVTEKAHTYGLGAELQLFQSNVAQLFVAKTKLTDSVVTTDQTINFQVFLRF